MLNLYALRFAKGAYAIPFVSTNHEQARATIASLIAEASSGDESIKSSLLSYPLCFLAVYDEKSGKFTNNRKPVKV